jgi:uncharacterized RDD family membrane protein YckC
MERKPPLKAQTGVVLLWGTTPPFAKNRANGAPSNLGGESSRLTNLRPSAGVSMPNMDRKSKRTIISIGEHQPELDFEEAAHLLPFTFPEYQRDLILPRIIAGLTDLGIVASIYLIFLIMTFSQAPAGFSPDKRVLGVYAVCFFALVAVYFLLFMLSASQTPGMKHRRLIVVTNEGEPLDTKRACMRGFGYLISILPVLLGFIWMLIDPEHLTWADKVSSTYIKKL